MPVVTLIVMEPGSAWPGHVVDSEDLVAMNGGDGSLLERTRQRLASLRRRGRVPRVAVLACSEATDDASLARRTDVARELLNAVAGSGFGRLVLTTSDAVSMRQRRELLSLAGTLSYELRGQTATVSVRFGQQDRREIGLADGVGGEVLSNVMRDHGVVQSG